MAETLLNLNQNNLDTQDASFVELINSTQIGKREIAQALIDKGADVTANSSLSDMASAANNLIVQSEASFECGFIPKEVKYGSNVNFDTTWNGGQFSYCKFLNGNLIIFNNNKLYMIDGSMFYEGLNDALSKAKFVYDMTTDGLDSSNTSSLLMTRSQDGTKIALREGKENVAVSRYIYNVDFENSSITLVRKYDTDYTSGNFQTYNQNPSNFCVSNNGRWIHEAHHQYGHFIDTVNDVHTQVEYAHSEWGYNSAYEQDNILFFFNEIDGAFDLCSHGGNGGDVRYKKLQINQDNTISFSTTMTTKAIWNKVYTNFETCQIDLDLNICYSLGHPVDFSYHKATNGDYINDVFCLTITDMPTGKFARKYFRVNWSGHNSSTYVLSNTKYNFLNFKKIDNGVYKIDNPLFNSDNVIFNKNTMEIISDKNDFISSILHEGGNNTETNQSFCVILKRDNASFISIGSMDFWVQPWKGRSNTTSPKFMCITEDTTLYIFGIKLEKNGYSTLFRTASGEAMASSMQSYLLPKETIKEEL